MVVIFEQLCLRQYTLIDSAGEDAEPTNEMRPKMFPLWSITSSGKGVLKSQLSPLPEIVTSLQHVGFKSRRGQPQAMQHSPRRALACCFRQSCDA